MADAQKTPFYITTAINYPNGRPHIGHAYEGIATDVMARFQRLMGRDVRFITGTDEHGLKMDQTARKMDRETIDLAEDRDRFRQKMEKLGIRPERLQLEWCSAAEAAKWQKVMIAAEDLRKAVTPEEIEKTIQVLKEEEEKKKARKAKKKAAPAAKK